MYVRKVALEYNSQDSTKKRTVQDGETNSNGYKKSKTEHQDVETHSNGCKKLKTDHQDVLLKEIEKLQEVLKMKDQLYQDNVKQIENLRQTLSQRDNEISTLHKIIASTLARKEL